MSLVNSLPKSMHACCFHTNITAFSYKRNRSYKSLLNNGYCSADCTDLSRSRVECDSIFLIGTLSKYQYLTYTQLYLILHAQTL